MKINVEVDCTPAEARAAMGLPDLTPLHDKYVSMMGEAMQGGVSPEILENVMKSWAPMGEAGMNFWRRMFESGTKPSG
jgi:oligoendopeptidase F